MASTVRRACPDKAASLSELAVRLKAYWGYDAAFMAVCRDDLSVAPEALTEKPYHLL